MVVCGRGAAEGAGVAACSAGADVEPVATGTAGADVTVGEKGGAEPTTFSELELLTVVADGWGTRVMLDGTAVIMAGFDGTCFAQIPA